MRIWKREKRPYAGTEEAEGGSREMFCKIRGKAFAHSSSLSRHMKLENKGGIGSIPCN